MVSLRGASKLLLPPIMTTVLQRLQSLFKQQSSSVLNLVERDPASDNLFDNEPNFLEECISTSKTYAEIGTGISTQFVLNSSNAKVYCVDSDPNWLKKATSGYESAARLRSKYVDIGKTFAWGIPVGQPRPDEFREYTDWIFKQEKAPDLLLIDGRFRVCCFFTALKYMQSGSKVIFDDYVNRPQYHFVERFLKPVDTRGRQALFEIPNIKSWDEEDLELAIEAFRYNLN